MVLLVFYLYLYQCHIYQQHGESALFLAARKGYPKIVQCLLEAGASSVYTIKAGVSCFSCT